MQIYCFPKFHCHIFAPSKVTGCSISIYFKQILIATSFEPQVLRTIFQSLFKGIKILLSFQKDKFVTHPIRKLIHRLLFIVCYRNLQVRPDHTILCCETDYAELSEKRHSSQEIPAPKKVPLLKKQLFGKSTRFEKVQIVITHSGEKASPKQ